LSLLCLDVRLRVCGVAWYRTAAEVVPGRAQNPAQVYTAVLVEALVLDRDDRVRDPRRDRAPGHEDSRLRAAQDREHRMPVARVDVGVRLLALVRGVRGVERAELRVDRAEEP